MITLSYLRRRFFFTMLVVQISCTAPEDKKMPVIPILRSSQITMDGSLDDWQTLPHIFKVTAFQSPWEKEPYGETVFCAFVDSHWFYFSYDVKDSTPITAPFTKEIDVASGDRVELFFSPSKSLENYYCIEITPQGNVLDYKACFYRMFNDTWDLKDFSVYTQIVDSGYRVEGRFPVHFLRAMTTEPGSKKNTFFLGLYRADYKKNDDNAVQWLTWIDPKSKDPDFHIPESFIQIIISD